MKILNKMRLILLLPTILLVVIMAVPSTSIATQQTVNLGTASGFAVLSGNSGITNVGMTTINGSAGGNVGTFPGTVFAGQSSVSVSGAIHLNDVVARQAQEDLAIAYNDAAGRLPVTRIPTELGGTTLTPGTYDSADGTFKITGTLTLDAQGDPDGVFIFKTDSNLLTASGSSINLINNAQSCQIFWKVGNIASLGANSHFAGNILALIAIRVQNGATVHGRLLARNETVTLNANTITNDICATKPEPATATLTVIKHVINDNFGTAVAADFNLHVKTASGSNVGGSPAPGVEAPGTTYTLAAGTYVVSEDAVAGYTTSYSGDSDSNGNITLNPGDNKTVTIMNNDIHPPGTAFLHVIKHVINDNGGTAVAADFNLHVKTASGNEINGSPAPGMEAPGTTYMMYFLMPGPISLVVSEDAVAGYTASYSGDSDSSGNITLNPGYNKTVIITNNDIPVQPPTATLNVIKHVINDDGGTAVAADFNLHVKTTAGIGVGGSPAPGDESGTTYTLPAGTYAVSEDGYDILAYGASYSGDFNFIGGNIITLNPGDNKTVTITNNDIIKEKPKPILDFTYGYINGYDTGNVGSEDPLTREEVSASLYRIFKQAGKIIGYTKPAVSDFTDLATNRWSYAAVEYMVSIGAIPKGATVKPTQPITRGEMAKIIAISNNMTNNESVVKYPDLPESHMYYDYMNMVVNHGLVKGYPDGQIKPDGLITRAEYITMVNRFIGRDNRYYVSGLPSLYWDLLPTHWAFADIQRASFGFTTTVDSIGFFQVDPDQKISKAHLDD